MQKRLVFLVIFLAILGCFVLNTANAASKGKTSKTKKASSKPVEKYDETVFDLNRESLPLAYGGHDAIKIYTALSVREKLSKSEYETTEQFNARLAKEQTKPILGKLTVDDIYTFMVKPESKYDADSKSLKLHIRKGDNIADGFNHFKDGIEISLKQISYKDSPSKEVNAYGASILVHNYRFESIYMALTNELSQFNLYQDNNSFDSRSYINITLENLTPEKAKEYKDNLTILFVAKLEKPYSISGTTYRAATFDHPSSSTSHSYYISCRAIEMWVYNFKTGSVLKRIKIPAITAALSQK